MEENRFEEIKAETVNEVLERIGQTTKKIEENRLKDIIDETVNKVLKRNGLNCTLKNI